jgi:hypothetical protein
MLAGAKATAWDLTARRVDPGFCESHTVTIRSVAAIAASGAG